MEHENMVKIQHSFDLSYFLFSYSNKDSRIFEKT